MSRQAPVPSADVRHYRYIVCVFILADSGTLQSDEQVNGYKWLMFLKPCNSRALARVVLYAADQTRQVDINCQYLTLDNDSVTHGQCHRHTLQLKHIHSKVAMFQLCQVGQ